MSESHPRLAIRYTRMMLVKAGLTEQEADALIDRLRSEFVTGTTLDDAARQTLIESFISNLGNKDGNRKLDVVKSAIGALLIGLAGNALYDLLKAEFLSMGEITTHGVIELPSHATIGAPLGTWKGELLIEWGLMSNLPGIEQTENCLRRALEIREAALGRFHRLTAVSCDALGMCLDGEDRHREAAGYRATALKIAKRASGPKHPDTAAALSNLGLCLIARGEFSDGEMLLRRSFDLMKRRFGLYHIWTMAALFNLYYGLKREGRFLQLPPPPQIVRGESSIQVLCRHMIAHKRVIVTIDAVQVVLEELKKALSKLPQQ